MDGQSCRFWPFGAVENKGIRVACSLWGRLERRRRGAAARLSIIVFQLLGLGDFISTKRTDTSLNLG